MIEEDNESTRIEIDKLYQAISDAQEVISIIREKCTHDKTKKGKYMWRPGAMADVIMCKYCDEVIKSSNDPENFVVTTSTSNNDEDDYVVCSTTE